MKPIDLTHLISPEMPVYPGTQPPRLQIESSIDDKGFLERNITMCSHIGTHIDAPAHLIKNHNTLDMLPIDHFYGPALLLNFAHLVNKTITVKQLEPYREKIAAVNFLLLYTGWDQYWGSADYFANYPVLSDDAAHWLSSFPLKGFGIDAISADIPESTEYPVHKALLRQNIIIIENLANLADLSCSQFQFCCFPLPFKDGDGSPVRAVAFVH